MSTRPPIYYGPCEGGPFHGKHLAEARPVSSVAYDKITKKYQGPIQAPNGDPNLRFGEYVFEGSTWIWHDAVRSASKTASQPESGS